MRWMVLLICLCALPADLAASPRFTDLSRSSGLPQTGPTCGLVVVDLDDDGRLDLVPGLHGSGWPPVLRQVRRLRFEPGPTLSDGRGPHDHHFTVVGDPDRDGHVELYFGVGADRGRGRGENLLLARLDGEWRDLAPVTGTADPWGRGRSAMFLDLEGGPGADLLVLNFETAPRLFVDLPLDGRAVDQASGFFAGTGSAPPDSASAPPSEQRHWVGELVAGHLDEDGRIDLLEFGDRVRIRVSQGKGPPVVTDAVVPRKVLDRRPGHGLVGDLDGDLRNDVYLVRGDGAPRRGPDGHNELWLQEEPGRFVRADPAGGALLDGTGHRIRAGDLDNDGHLDLVVLRRRDRMRDRPHAVLRGLGQGRFEEVAADWGLAGPHRGVSQDVLVCDLDRDGDLDLVFAQGDHTMKVAAGGFRLFENRSPAEAQAIQFVLVAAPPGAVEAYGARMVLFAGSRSWRRDHWPTQCDGSAMPLPVHFGLGAVDRVDSVAVRWPGGRREVARDLPATGLWEWREGSGPRRLESVERDRR